MTARHTIALILSVTAAVSPACGGKSPTAPAGNNNNNPSTGTTNAAPTLDAPSADQQLDTLRPTLRVKNGTSAVAGSRSYEFQIADRPDFGGSAGSAHYTVALTRSGVVEGSGTTAAVIDQDLQPATRFYWRARWVQGANTGEWSSTFTFRTQIVGFNRPGELYDPLVNGSTVAEARGGTTSFVDGKGLRLHDTDAFARYRLVDTIGSGEFSVDVEGLSTSPVSSNGDTGKLKIISMDDNPSNHYTSDYLMNVQYRGFLGNPDHAISFKMLLGEDVEERKLEPDLNMRRASVRTLNPANTYHWKATWANSITVVVQDGGVGGVNGSGTGVGGATIYEYGKTSPFSYQPGPHFAYLGVNSRRDDTGSWPATYRNVWIGNKPRPASLGSAMVPLR